MNHRQKQRLARKNRTYEEIVNRVPIFQTEFWENRKNEIREKVLLSELNRKNGKNNKVA